MRRNRIEEIVDIFGNFITDTPSKVKAPEITVVTENSEEVDEAE